MRIEIDQSGKVEDTGVPTVIGFSNHIQRSLVISARDKRAIQRFFREIGRPKVFAYKLFAILIFLAIKPALGHIDEIAVDCEYTGWEALIKDYLLRELRKACKGRRLPEIVFHRIGKESQAHLAAYGTMRKKRNPDVVVTARQVLRYLVK